MLFWDRLWTLTEHISATNISTTEKKTVQSTGTPLHAPKFGELWSRNGWERLACFCTPLMFTLGDTASLTAWTLYNRQQANFGTCYVVARAYSLEQQKAGRAHAGLRHASSLTYYPLFFIYCKLCRQIPTLVIVGVISSFSQQDYFRWWGFLQNFGEGTIVYSLRCSISSV